MERLQIIDEWPGTSANPDAHALCPLSANSSGRGIAPCFVELGETGCVNNLSGLRSLGKSRVIYLPSAVSGKRGRKAARCLKALSLRKPFLASCMAAAVQRDAIEDEHTLQLLGKNGRHRPASSKIYGRQKQGLSAWQRVQIDR